MYWFDVCLLSLWVDPWSLFKSPALWDKLYLDWILDKGDQLFKFVSKSGHLGMEDLPQKFLIETPSINVEFSENKTG